jgi:hypothetical protein
MFPSMYPDADAQKLLNEWRPEHSGPLVQIQDSSKAASDELQTVSGD